MIFRRIALCLTFAVLFGHCARNAAISMQEAYEDGTICYEDGSCVGPDSYTWCDPGGTCNE